MQPGNAIPVPERPIETINKLVRTSQKMLTEIGRNRTAEELAERLAMPLDTVHRLLRIVMRIMKGEIARR